MLVCYAARSTKAKLVPVFVWCSLCSFILGIGINKISLIALDLYNSLIFVPFQSVLKVCVRARKFVLRQIGTVFLPVSFLLSV